MPRAGRVTTTGRIMATAIPSAGSPASVLAPVASIGSLGCMVAASTVAASTVAASTVGRLFTAQPGSAVSAWGSDIWVASAGDNWTIGTIAADADAIRFKAATGRLPPSSVRALVARPVPVPHSYREGTEGSQTLRWREMDSNFRFRASSAYTGVGACAPPGQSNTPAARPRLERDQAAPGFGEEGEHCRRVIKRRATVSKARPELGALLGLKAVRFGASNASRSRISGSAAARSPRPYRRFCGRLEPQRRRLCTGVGAARIPG